jgi:hypothetical protein
MYPSKIVNDARASLRALRYESVMSLGAAMKVLSVMDRDEPPR